MTPARTEVYGRWRLPGGRWTWDHQFIDGRALCGRRVPGGARFETNTKPIVTCGSCLVILDKRAATSGQPPTPDDGGIGPEGAVG